MNISSDLISQLVKVTNDTPETKKDSTVYGTIKEYEGSTYVQIDGSDQLTPVSTLTTTKLSPGERVIVTIKNHSAVVTGNLTSPSARWITDDSGNKSVEGLDIDDAVTKLNTVMADNIVVKEKLAATEGEISKLKAEDVTISGKVTAAEGDISKLKTDKLDATVAKNTYATIENLTATNTEVNTIKGNQATFTQTTTEKLAAVDASIKDLNAKKLSATDIEGKYANLDFSNIGTAAVEKFYAVSGIIKNLTLESGTVVKELIGVLIKGDLIEGGTIAADKLIVKGEDGLYYKLNVNALGETTAKSDPKYQNGLDGSVIIAKSIAAEKINVSDLKAFGATIGGFKISDSAIHSSAKTSASNTTRGIYMDNLGQFVVGDASNYIKYFKDTDGNYKLDISMMSNYATKKDIDAINSKFEHDQLIVNGGGEMGNNTNFSKWIFDGAVTNNSAGSFTSEAKYYQNISTDEMFLVNPQKEYTLSIDAKTKNQSAVLYAFLNFMDVDKNVISCDDHIHVKGSLTTLARDLNPGDTKIYFTDLSGWSTTTKYMYHIIMWLYTNSYGYMYPPETYSKTHYRLPYTSDSYLDANSIDLESNTITLSSPWSGIAAPAGTKVSQGGTGSTYKYLIVAVTPKADWATYTGKIKGTDYSGKNANNKFPPGAVYANVGFLWNFNGADDQIWMTNVSLRDTTEMTDTQNAITETKASIKATNDSITAVVTRTTNVENKVSNMKIGGRNFLLNSEGEFPSYNSEYVNTGHDLAPIFEKYGLVQYTLSMDIKSADVSQNNKIQAYCQNGNGSLYDIGYNSFTVTTEWQRLSCTFTPKKNTNSETKALLAFYGTYNTGNIPHVRRIKLELGNKATDWTPAVEEMATAEEVDTAQNTAEKAQSTANTAQESASDAAALIKQLADSISMLVTDGNGTSLMTQTEDGWTFSTAEINGSVNDISNALATLTESTSDTEHAVSILQEAVRDLGEIAEYVSITTYEDEPCIELGEGDSDFKLRITNTRMLFTEGSDVLAYFTNQSFNSKRVVVEEELQQGGFVWAVRANGNLGLSWKGVNS